MKKRFRFQTVLHPHFPTLDSVGELLRCSCPSHLSLTRGVELFDCAELVRHMTVSRRRRQVSKFLQSFARFPLWAPDCRLEHRQARKCTASTETASGFTQSPNLSSISTSDGVVECSKLPALRRAASSLSVVVAARLWRSHR